VHLWLLVAVLVYAPKGDKDPRRAEVQSALEKAVGADLDPHALRTAIAERTAGWVRAETLQFFADGRARMEEGRRLLERVELEAADGAFAEAERIYEAQLAWPGVAPLWSQAALWRGVAAFQRGQPAAARRLFQRAVALDPSTRLTEASVRPDVVRAFSDAVKPRPAVKLTVKSREGAEILVDGKPAVGEVAAGEHVVVARLAGHLPAAALIDAHGPLELELLPAPDPALALLESLKRGPNRAGLAELARARSLDQVLVASAGMDAGELALAAERADDKGCVTPPATVVAKHLDRAAASLWEKLQRAEPRCPGVPEELLAVPALAHPRPAPVAVKQTLPPPKKKKIWERPWLWLGLVAVTSISVGLAAGLSTTDTSYRATVDGSAFTR
jgi:hypothetical protein